jgi:predicted small secreted protein
MTVEPLLCNGRNSLLFFLVYFLLNIQLYEFCYHAVTVARAAATPDWPQPAAYPHLNAKEIIMHLKKFIVALIYTLALALLVQGCNTMQGAGKDIEEAGEAVQDAAD